MMAQVQIDYAYHVTNVPANQQKPSWDFLQANKHRSLSYDGILCFLNIPCVYLSTTLYRGELPTLSPYPVEGRERYCYWRVRIPIEQFNGYNKFWLVMNTGKSKHNRLVLTRNETEEKIIHELYSLKNRTTEDEITANRPIIRNLLVDENSFLRRSVDGLWYSNDYSDVLSRYFTEFFVFGDVPLTSDFKWDLVPHSKPSDVVST